jgi:hypothetical protein
MSFSEALGGISVRWVKSRVSLQKEPLGLYDPNRTFVFAAESGIIIDSIGTRTA